MNQDKQSQHSISFSIFECLIVVNSESLYLISILKYIYAAMETHQSDKTADLVFNITLDKSDQKTIGILRKGMPDLVTDDIGEFIYLFEKDMTIELQKIRSDLLFIHSAALHLDGVGVLLVAPSGTGKSTTAWGLINSGFNYLSDELAPVDLNTMLIEPYPHALCLKSKPPMYKLPEECLFTENTIHVYGDILSKAVQRHPVHLRVVVFLEYDPGLSEPEMYKISRGEASAKLYANSLNILAHSNSGSDSDSGMQAAIKIATHTFNYCLRSNELDKTSEKLKTLIQSIA